MQNTAEIIQLSVAFQRPNETIHAIDTVSFNLYPGKTLVLLGESGCGKSLTSLAIMRLLPLSGVYGRNSQIHINGLDILELSERDMRQLRGRQIAMIFQEPMTSLNPVMTIGNQLREILLEHHSYPAYELKEAIITLLHEVEMPEPEIRMHQYPHQLSGGQKQRVMIAMALACKPDILIADEPTTALDVTVQAQILSLLKKIQNHYKMSILLITHDLGVARYMGDEICVMYAGQVVDKAPTEEFFTQVKHPYVQQLLASMPSWTKRHNTLSVIQGAVPVLDALPSGCRFHPRCFYAFARCKQEEPALQTVNNRIIRCHLYPELEQLPKLPSHGGLSKHALEDDEHDQKTLLQVENLSVYFGKKKGLFGYNKGVFKAVDGLSFHLKSGKTLALVGESGCGKTSASRALLRLIPKTSGDIYYKNQDISTLKGRGLREYRKRVQVIFQDPYSSMNPRMTVGEIIAEGMHAQKMKPAHIHNRLKVLLNHMRLPERSLDRYPHQFSGGQRQRICIARALATEPDILICDEPTSALDISVQAQILNVLKELQQETQMTYLFITHNLGVVSYIADEVLVMKDGKAMEYGPCEQILKHPKHPYTRELLSAVLPA